MRQFLVTNFMLSERFFFLKRETYANVMTVKSSQFHGSRRNVKSSKQKPLARILISDSKV